MTDPGKTVPDGEREETSWFGYRLVPARVKNVLVRRHFEIVARRYDFMNSLLSFGLHHLWKRKTVALMAPAPGERVLDVCGGTGDLSVRAARRIGDAGLVVLLDINRAMIEAGRPKVGRPPLGRRIVLLQGDAEALPLADASFDAAMVGFGIRNVTRVEQGFREMHRALKPGGRLLCLEFSMPVNPVFRALYNFYSFAVMPLAGRLLTGSRQAYTYLPESIRTFPDPPRLAAMLEGIGFSDVTWTRCTNGIAVIHRGVKR